METNKIFVQFSETNVFHRNTKLQASKDKWERETKNEHNNPRIYESKIIKQNKKAYINSTFKIDKKKNKTFKRYNQTETKF